MEYLAYMIALGVGIVGWLLGCIHGSNLENERCIHIVTRATNTKFSQTAAEACYCMSGKHTLDQMVENLKSS
jgi:hypothetical protein